MAVFFDTGGGEIYGGASRADVIAAMRADLGDDFDEEFVEELSPDQKVGSTDENEQPTGEFLTLAEAFSGSDAYCFASTNH